MTDEGGPDMVSFREAAKRVVAEEIAPSMTHQRVSQMCRDDPEFPAVFTVGRTRVLDWTVARPYFVARAAAAARRDSRRRMPKPPASE